MLVWVNETKQQTPLEGIGRFLSWRFCSRDVSKGEPLVDIGLAVGGFKNFLASEKLVG